MGRQLIAMGMRMSVMPRGKSRFCLRMMGRLGMRAIHRVVLIFVLVTLLVLAGVRCEMGQGIMGVGFWHMSG